MTTTTVRFRPGELEGVLDVLDPAGWVNLRPEVDEALGLDTQISHSWVASMFSNKGPQVPLATWHPGERSAGVQHSSGPKVARRLDVPAGWRVVQDHPRRGLVLRVPAGVPDDEVLHWLVAATTAVATVPLLGGWVAEVHGP